MNKQNKLSVEVRNHLEEYDGWSITLMKKNAYAKKGFWLKKEMIAEIEKQYSRALRKEEKPIESALEKLNRLYIRKANVGFLGIRSNSVKFDVIKSEDNKTLALVKMSGFIHYTKKEYWKINRAFFVGKDNESGWFSNQVNSNCNTVIEAIEWMKPSIVKLAEKENRIVIRQGDIFFVQMKRNCKIDEIYNSHEIIETSTGYEIRHAEHETVILEGKNWKAINQKKIVSSDD